MDVSWKEYQAAFLLEPTKFERLMEVIHERLAHLPDTTVSDHFEVFMTGNRCDELNTIEQVLAVENSKKHRVERLLIVSSSVTEGARRPEYEVRVDFGVVKPPKTTTGTTSSTAAKLVTVEVKSEAPNWNRQTLSQVEEQVERTWLHQTTPVLSLFLMVLLLAGFFLVQFKPRLSGGTWAASNRLWLDDKELDRVQQAVKENRTLTDEEIREITTGQLRNVLQHVRPVEEPETEPGRTRPLLLFGIPFLLLVGLAIYLGLSCYPGAVFLWGDEVERYEAVKQRRKLLWGLITGILIIGVAGKLLSEGVLSWLPK